MKIFKIAILLIFVILIFWMGFRFGEGKSPKEKSEKTPAEEQTEIWTCSMHPQIKQQKPGKCPLCGMDLIPLQKDTASSEGDKPMITLSPYAEKLAEVSTAPVIRKFVTAEIRMVGKIAFDEYTMSYITARMPGRIDKLYVNYTGIAVKKGDHIAEVYSPDLLLAQQELLQSLKFAKADGEFAVRTLNSVKEKYRLWGFSDSQIQEIIQRGNVADHLTITAPISGIVIEKSVREGQYFEKGEKLFAIADLNRLWVNLEAYETDIPWIKYGQDVEFTTEAEPGKIFKGKIAFIQPVLDEMTRTIKLRLNVDNHDGMLKPGMFVRAILRAEIADNEKVVNDNLAGKWVSPMHPEIVKDQPGACDICGMPLVSAESLGFADKKDKKLIRSPLIIPASAPLVTGKRAVVYVAVPGKKGTYEGREIQLGAKAGDFYIVKSGLKEGENVVVSGAFKIDSSVQIHGMPSMMTPYPADEKSQEKTPEKKSAHNHAVPLSNELLGAYFSLQKALFHDNIEEAIKHAGKLDERYSTKLSEAKDLKAARESFAGISSYIYNDIKADAGNLKGPVYKFLCPMAFDNKGAFWFQDSDKIQNPYFGHIMPNCGELQETISGAK